jgi:hypothetical protein
VFILCMQWTLFCTIHCVQWSNPAESPTLVWASSPYKYRQIAQPGYSSIPNIRHAQQRDNTGGRKLYLRTIFFPSFQFKVLKMTATCQFVLNVNLILFIPCIILTINHIHQQMHTVGLQTEHRSFISFKKL